MGMRRREHLDALILECSIQLRPDQAFSLFARERLVVAVFGLGRRRERWLRQTLSLPQPTRERRAVHRA